MPPRPSFPIRTGLIRRVLGTGGALALLTGAILAAEVRSAPFPPDSGAVPGTASHHWPETEPLPAVEGTPLTSLRITGAAFTPRETDVSVTTDGNGSCTYVAGGDANTVFNVTPLLPQGAVVNTLRMYYYDTSASNTTAWFTIYDLYGGIVDEWSVSSSVSGGNSFNDTAPIDHTIDYSAYSYLINWRPVISGSTMQLCGIRLFYVSPHLFRDGFESGSTSAWN